MIELKTLFFYFFLGLGSVQYKVPVISLFCTQEATAPTRWTIGND